MGTSAMRQSSGPSSEKLAWSTYLFGRGRPRAPPAEPWERWRAGAAPIRARDARTAVCAICWNLRNREGVKIIPRPSVGAGVPRDSVRGPPRG